MIGPNHEVKVCDFGLAISGEGELHNSFVGTLAYSCPEIIENHPYDGKADIWALGCIAYELLRGCAPFQGNPLQVAKKIVNTEYESLEQHPPEMVRFIEMCLTRDPDRRPNIGVLLSHNSIHLTSAYDQLK
jgi:NIMA (never in mitosis gene a)-related kinase